MKKLSFLIILFLFSCSDTETSKEQSELNRCINANISIIENSNMERLLEFPEVLGLPVKLDIDYIKSTFSELELEISKKKIIDNPSNKNAEEYIKSLQEEEILAENLIINLDDEEVSVTPVSEEKRKLTLKFFFPDTTNVDYDSEKLNSIISSTIRLADMDELAKNICWSQGIY